MTAWSAALPRALHGRNALVAASLLLLGIACVTPRVTLQRPTLDLLVGFDITQSMDVEDAIVDGAPASRLAAARAAMRLALRTLPCGSRVGWAVFTDYRTMPLLLPLEVCAHYDELLASLDRIDGRMRWAEASNVGKGVSWALRSARAVDHGTRVVFFTDGQESPPLREGETPPIQDLSPGEVGGWLVGVGSSVAQPIPRTDRDGHSLGTWRAEDVVQRPGLPAGSSHEELSAQDTPHLQALARLMGLDLLRLDGPASLASALQQGLGDPRFAQQRPVETDLRWLPALLAVLLLALRFGTPPRRLWRRLRSARTSAR